MIIHESTASQRNAGLHPYFGKVNAELAAATLERIIEPGQTVLDPFCGSGTVLFEALRLGCNVVAWDSSPLATMIAAANIVGLIEPEAREAEVMLTDFVMRSADARFVTEANDLPAMPRVHNRDKWFTRNAMLELATVKTYLDHYPFTAFETQLAAKTAFSRVVIDASNQQGESVYRMIEKPDHPGRVFDAFAVAMRDVLDKSVSRATQLGWASPRASAASPHSYEVVDGRSCASIRWRDSREPDKRPFLADAVVTSPPYLMSWDYGLYHKFRFYWLGLDLDAYEETEIGRHLRRKKDDVARYVADMTSTFAALDRVVSPQGKIVFVNAPSVVYGEFVDTNKLLGECGAVHGWKLRDVEASIGIPGPHHGMYASLVSRSAVTSGEAGKREHILTFTKDR